MNDCADPGHDQKHCACMLRGIKRAIVACREIDDAGQRDGRLREAIDCVEVLERLVDDLQRER